jgi:hypothetical protein
VTEEIEVRVPRKVDARVAEEIDAGVTADIEVQMGETALGEPALAEAPPPPRIQHAVPDRGRARLLFERLSVLPEGDAERLRIRGELVELHLPLVEYLARRFRNRGEWLDDLT